MISEYLIEGVFFSTVAFLLAIHEIEVEGSSGWAENLPTARTDYKFLGDKPLTGYHLTLGLALLVFLHQPFFTGKNWSLSSELSVLAKSLLILPVWDYLWFVLNPGYGLEKFKREHIPWYDEKWVLDRFPITYLYPIIGASLFASGVFLLTGKTEIFYNILVISYTLAITVILSLLISPYYRSFRSKAIQKDS